jgi:hypothetical protein
VVKYTYTKGRTGEIQNPTHWHLLARSMTHPVTCVIAQQYSSHKFNSLRFNSRKAKYNGRFKKVIISKFNSIKTA